ncbi:hypothetical protein B0H14DRAFT_3128181 [Mycena olivaceomarginata]|nr:hypothetical protein B0H14DRAFT_3128181 [Mycena olivaceomarginata]
MNDRPYESPQTTMRPWNKSSSSTRTAVVTVTMSSLLSLGALYPSVLCKTCLPTIASCSPTSVGSMPMTKNKQELAEVEGLPAAMRIITAKSTLSMQPGLLTNCAATHIHLLEAVNVAQEDPTMVMPCPSSRPATCGTVGNYN